MALAARRAQFGSRVGVRICLRRRVGLAAAGPEVEWEVKQTSIKNFENEEMRRKHAGPQKDAKGQATGLLCQRLGTHSHSLAIPQKENLMDESPAMKEHYWQSTRQLRKQQMRVSGRMYENQVTGSPQWIRSIAKTRRADDGDLIREGRVEVKLTDICSLLEAGRHNLAVTLMSVVQERISMSRTDDHRVGIYLKFVRDVVRQVGNAVQSIRGPLTSGSSNSSVALTTLPPHKSQPFWSQSHSLGAADESQFPAAQNGTTNRRSFDAFLDGRDLEAQSRAQHGRPDWVKEPSQITLGLAKGVAESAVEGWSGFIRPIDKVWPLSSSFGPRWGRHHNGVDLAAPTGEPVLASDTGEVTFSGWDPGYGNLVEITHRDGWKTLYAHNSEIFTWEGNFVRRGECIALVGDTGRATGPHLHWEIRNSSGKPINPCNHLDL